MEEEKRRGGNTPKDIVEEILVKLPVKLLVRFKAVSREWRGTIESKSFTEKHIGYQKCRRGHTTILTLSTKESYNGLFLEILLFSTNGIVHKNSPYQLPITSFLRFQYFKVSEPCDGLFCLYTITRISIFNPATTCCRTLPERLKGGCRDYLLGIGRETSVRRRYKLVLFTECDHKESTTTKCMVFALDSNTWRHVDPPHCRLYYGHTLLHLNGVIYCFARDNGKEDGRVVAFDLHTETFQSFLITPDIESRLCHKLRMRVLNHRLCIFKKFIDGTNDDQLFRIWGLNINQRSWETMYSVDLSALPLHLQNWTIIPMATFDNYLVISNDIRSFWLLYDSINHIVFRTFSLPNCKLSNSVVPYFETLVSPYQ